MMYLDTHVLIWLYEGLLEKFNSKAKLLLEENELFISPVVSLELQYLYEIKRISASANDMINDLTNKLGLTTCDAPLIELINLANQLNWTRDPFDRLIVAGAKAKETLLLTKDISIRKNYAHAVWD